MAAHSSTLAWRIPGIGEPGGPLVYGVTQSRTRLKDIAAAAAATHTHEDKEQTRK